MIPGPKSLTLEEALRSARETRYLELDAGVLKTTPDVFRRLFGDQPALLVADANSWTFAGEALAEAFRGVQHPKLPPFIFRVPDLHAEFRFVDELIQAFQQHRAIPVAVGSGTVNDLVKLAAHRTDRPYLCVATAASMDGYTAFGASITYQGSKQTYLCPAPTAVVADLDVIAGAPVEMNSWGYADLLAKVTAGADWIVADALGVEPIEPQAWAIVQGRLREMVANPAGVKTRDPDALRGLVEGLMLGGFAMQSAKSSRPASGAEHQFSHLWDMQHHTHNSWPPSQGFKVGIGTIAVTALYEQLLARPLEQLDVERCCANWPDETEWRGRVHNTFSAGELRDVAEREIAAKQISLSELRTQLNHLRTNCAGWMVAAFEISGVAGMLLGGWITDKVFGGRGGRACLIYMALAGVALFCFWKNPFPSMLVNTGLLCCAGFFIYGPQALVGITAANLATKRAAATAIGFTGMFAYASTILSGWGLGTLVDRFGWDAALGGLVVIAVIGTLLFAFVWPARPHGYAVTGDPT